MTPYRLPIKTVNGFSIVLHTESINERLDRNDERILRLLEWKEENLFQRDPYEAAKFSFDFLRTPEPSSHSILKEILEYHIEPGDEEDVRLIRIDWGHEQLSTGYYENPTILRWAAGQLTDMAPSDPSYEKLLHLVEYFFTIAALNNQNKKRPFLLCTENEFLLSQRNRVKIPGSLGPSVVANLDETMHLLDLCMKSHDEYRLGPNQSIKGKNSWYDILAGTSINFRHVGKNSSDGALFRRLSYLLRTNDEMAFYYYSEVNNETTDYIIYLFHYYLALAVGIFDSLATIINNEYQLNCSKGQLSISFTRSELLNRLQKKNVSLHQFIIERQDIIKTISDMRNEVMHRQMLDRMIVDMRGADEAWIGGCLEVSLKNYDDLLGYCHGSENIGRTDNHGLFKIWADNLRPGQDAIYFIEPYELSKALTSFVFAFVNRTLELLGWSRIDDTQQNPNPLCILKKSALRLLEKSPEILTRTKKPSSIVSLRKVAQTP